MSQPATAVPATSRPARFGVFEFELQSGELRKNGTKLKVEGQPLEILALLLERPGEVVTREELKQELWPADTFVDFEHSINAAVKRLREALDDSATSPRFIETLPRRGYRFIYPLNSHASTAGTLTPVRRRTSTAAAVIATLVLLASAAFLIPGLRQRLTGRFLPGKTLRVAVLPLRNLSDDPQQEYFAAGVTEMLITELGSIGALQVKSHQSVLGYTQSTKPLPQIARELEVDALLEGTVQRAGNRVRVTVNFVQADPENHLLAKSYEKDMRDVFDLQEQVAQAIAGEIRANVAGSRARVPARPVAPEATDAFLRGAYLLAKGRDSDREDARVSFLKAIEADPAFARPYAYLAVMYSHGGAVRAGAAGDARNATRQWALKALQLDPSLAEAHTALGWVEITDWNFKQAEQEFRQAIELNPSYAQARAWYAQFLGTMHRYPEAFAQADVALQLAPGFPNIVSHAVEPYVAGGRVDDAIAQWNKVVELQPDYWPAHYFLALGYMKKGAYPQAVAPAEEAVRLTESSRQALAVLASAYAKAGQRARALQIVADLEKPSAAKPPGNMVAVAAAYASLGENEKALALLEKGLQSHAPGLPFVNDFPQFDALRTDPRFRDLSRRVGLPAQ